MTIQNFYDSTRPSSYERLVGKHWITEPEIQELEELKIRQNLYLDIHSEADGGPFKHPYGHKAKLEGIPYYQLNILKAASNGFADLIVGENPKLQSLDAKQGEILKYLQDKIPCWEALVRASYSGFVGLQPVQVDKNKTEDYWTFQILSRDSLVYKRSEQGEIVQIKKRCFYKDIKVESDKKINILLVETHYRGSKETALYRVAANSYEILDELDLSYYQYIDNTTVLEPYWETGLEDFEIQLVFNARLKDLALSDYNKSAIKHQEGLNSILTQIKRILFRLSDPVLMAPISSAVKDNNTGEYRFAQAGSEVLFYDKSVPGAKDAYSYLTWDGSLTEQNQDLDKTILMLCAELKWSPYFLTFTNLVQTTTADTAEKLRQLLDATLKVANRKKQFFDRALRATLNVILIYEGVQNPEFEIVYPEMLPESYTEKLNTAIQKRENDLTTTKDVLMALDNLTKEQADAKVLEIFKEKQVGMGGQDSLGRVMPGEDEGNIKW